jgi:hypothetical protein
MDIRNQQNDQGGPDDARSSDWERKFLGVKIKFLGMKNKFLGVKINFLGMKINFLAKKLAIAWLGSREQAAGLLGV